MRKKKKTFKNKPFRGRSIVLCASSVLLAQEDELPPEEGATPPEDSGTPPEESAPEDAAPEEPPAEEEAPEEESAQRTFTVVAYTGGPMILEDWDQPVIIDLEGLDISQQRRPVLLDHAYDVDSIVGQTETITISDGQLMVAGVVLNDSPQVERALALYDRGFAWQASVGVRPEEVETVPEGATAEVNGREIAGPAYIVRRATLGEISFVVLGADDQTSVQIAARKRRIGRLDLVGQLRAEAFAESRRISAIRKICAQNPELAAKAIAKGWDIMRTELELLRASRPTGPTVYTSGAGTHSVNAIEAALCLTARIPEEKVARWYGQRVVDQAQSRDLHGIGLHELIYRVIQASGRHVRPGRVTNDIIRTAFETDRQIRASARGFSTLSLTNILSNVANKVLLDSFTAVETVAPRICAQSDVKDFKQVTRYRLTGGGLFEKVGPDGELKHAKLTEEAYANQLETYGTTLTLTRQMIVNDDLGAFLQIPRILGRQSALAVETAVFSLLLSNPNNFFSTAHRNLLTGTNSALSISGLTKAEQMFLDQVDADGKPVLISPAILLVPSSLKVTAQQLMTETRVNETTAPDSPKPSNNPHAGKWIPLASPYLNSQGLPGSSATAWYLFADPADVAAMELVYLNGQRTPVIESGEADFDTLGIRWRGYFDFGVAMQDYRAAVKSTGT